MSNPEYITKIAEREAQYNLRSVWLPVFEQRPEDWEKQLLWEQKYKWRINFSVHKDNADEAKRLRAELWEFGENIAPQKEQEIIAQLMKIKVKDYDEQTDLEKWKHFAFQLPEDIGGPRKEDIKKYITSYAQGKVLETMCGFNSYFDNSKKINEVVVLDYCREMLERYARPERTRILYDLNKVIAGEKLDFFKEGEFQTIGCWGSNYLTNPVPVFSEFYRILSAGGKFIILESTTEGYKDLIKRYFKPEECAESMKQAGFSVSIKHLNWLKTKGETGEYYSVLGVKK